MATKKTTKPGRPSRKYIAVTAYLAFDPDEKLKDMMSLGKHMAKQMEGSYQETVKVTVKKSDGPYPKKLAKATGGGAPKKRVKKK